MANIKSQKKRILTNEKARLRNNAVKSELKTATRKVKAAVEAQNQEAAVEALRFVNRKLDKAVSKGVLHKKTAANKKSGLAALSKTCGVPKYLSGLRAETPCVPPPLRGTQGVSFSCILGFKELDNSSATLSLTYWCGNNAWAAAALCFGLKDRSGASLANSS